MNLKRRLLCFRFIAAVFEDLQNAIVIISSEKMYGVMKTYSGHFEPGMTDATIIFIEATL